MSEFCKKCFLEINKLSAYDVREFKFSGCDYFCERCGDKAPLVLSVSRYLFKRAEILDIFHLVSIFYHGDSESMDFDPDTVVDVRNKCITMLDGYTSTGAKAEDFTPDECTFIYSLLVYVIDTLGLNFASRYILYPRRLLTLRDKFRSLI